MRSTTVLKLALAATLVFALPGCNAPRGAGKASEILKGADQEDADFQVVQVSRETVARLGDWPGIGSGSGISGWISRQRGPAGNLIAAGDKIDLTIWETGDVTLLSAPGQKLVALPGLTVSPDGSVYLPYADKVYIANMTADQAREAVQKKLDPIIPSAQVLIAHQPGRKSTVDLVSGVPRPGAFPMPDRDFTVLGLIAQGGGIPHDMDNPQVRLMRDGKLYGISADRLMKEPALDTTLRGGDKVWVEADERYFIALGASGRESQVRFSQDRITALEALSMSGGLNDIRADAKGVLILRNYPASALKADGSGPGKQRVIFAIDLTSADGLFSAGQFQVQNKDVVVVAESPIGSAASVLGLAAAVLGIGRTAQAISE
ncbi:polysaccharide biosynthesis/export family protein [Pseudogemmobacter humi]|uniref:Polysaccharide biosynthesis/export protein n=1 Tax=Pseudogemmobacter humi TaxID=2483812 RepID=A0A3P5WIL7_9RHOB|nr:polysaccharide biosynthesis/export family protein [Pseudogemmobacter humi]VDC23533.1 Polysaccharide biosynthesis/export protein [Pseudogemmobacter humi]